MHRIPKTVVMIVWVRKVRPWEECIKKTGSYGVCIGIKVLAVMITIPFLYPSSCVLK